MTDKNLIDFFFSAQGVPITEASRAAFEEFVQQPEIKEALEQVRFHQKQIMEKWQILERVRTIERQHVALPNGTAGKAYEAVPDLEAWGWADLELLSFEGFEAIGLTMDEGRRISGVPTKSGDARLTVRYRVPGEPEETPLHERQFILIINPDPRTLWQNKESDATDPHAKSDEAQQVVSLGYRTLVVASKRGRSHANVGSFREDHFASKYFEETGWSVVAVSDGAGSAALSRKGSALACEAVLAWFTENFTHELVTLFESDLVASKQAPDEAVQKRMSAFIYSTLQAAAWKAHKELEAFAQESGASLRDLHSTLVFSAFKKTGAGWVFLSFGVGDCPIALLSKDLRSLSLLSVLDVGEFSGGTRFITMPDIFAAEKFQSRINFKLTDDFGYLVLMTDGIYDPKFGVEANLERVDQWAVFFADLAGKNEERHVVNLVPENSNAGKELLDWMDFWSPGNHDDRTLAIVF